MQWGHRENGCPPKLERQTGRYRESQLTGAQTHEQKFPEQENLKCDRQIAGGSVWTGLRVKKPRGPSRGRGAIYL